MTSPFPGMDPYLERSWGDIHQRFITYSCDWIQPRLPSDLRARMQERVYLELPEGRREYYPDVRVFEHRRREARRESAQPMTLAVYLVSLRERLPVIAIPLRADDHDVTLDLQAVLDQCYRNGGYDDIDYRAEPDPPLAGDDVAWADAILREKGYREPRER